MMKIIVSGFYTAALVLFAGSAAAVPASSLGTWERSLQSRDLDRDGITDAFYDTTLNVTWLLEAKEMPNWDAGNTWVRSLASGGYTDWRWPTNFDSGAPGCFYGLAGTTCGYNVLTKSGDVTQFEFGQTVYSEFAHLFFITLGNKSICAPPNHESCSQTQSGSGLLNTGNFTNIQSGSWYGFESGLTSQWYSSGFVWFFDTSSGFQSPIGVKPNQYYMLALRDGDVQTPVPEPQTYLLMLIGLIVIANRSRRVCAEGKK